MTSIKINSDGQLMIEVRELVEAMDEECRKQFYQHLAFQDTLMIAVVETIADGVCFEGDWWSSRLESKIREKLLPLVGQSAVELFRDNLEKMQKLENQVKHLTDKFSQLLDHWPNEISRPNDCKVDELYGIPCTCAWNKTDVISYLLKNGIKIDEPAAT